MSQAFINIHIHCIFSTKHRHPLIAPEMQGPLWAYMGGLARNHGMKALAAGGFTDHAHVLLSLPATVAIAKAVQIIKGGSSYWLGKEFDLKGRFAWQRGYGAFSVHVSLLEETARYIRKQPEHHERYTLEEEYTAILKRHGQAFELDGLWD